nr:type VI secretion system-associated protein VasI [uncultured Halomonas sp.]
MSLKPIYRGSLLLALLLLTSPAWSTQAELEQAQGCAMLESRLERLNCYDDLFRVAAEKPTDGDPRPAQWYAVKALEQGRGDDFTFRLTREQNGDVLMSAPALGTTAPRPRLVISCDDTITRLQLHVDQVLDEGRTQLNLNTAQATMEQAWRIRDGGYLVSGGRGLPAIDTLRRLLGSETLSLGSDIPALDGLRFDVSDLRAQIQPLREACRW